jgi:hypothetical protein
MQKYYLGYTAIELRVTFVTGFGLGLVAPVIVRFIQHLAGA